jgi:hypothetical protein
MMFRRTIISHIFKKVIYNFYILDLRSILGSVNLR